MTDDQPVAVSRWRVATVPHLDIYGVAILAIGLIALALRAYHLGEQSLWLDEVDEGTTAQAPFSQFFYDVRADFGAAPLDYLGVKLVTSFLGHGTIATRSWAFAMGCISVGLIYALAVKLTQDRLVGLISAVMLATSAFHIYYSQEARFYALPVVVAMLSLYAFVNALRAKTAKAWFLYACVMVLALYSHYFLAVLLPIQGLYVFGTSLWSYLANREATTARTAAKQIGMCLAAQVGAFVAFLPWLLFALPSQVAGGYPALPALGIDRVHQIFVVLIGLAPLNSVHGSGIGQIVRTDIVLLLAGVGLIVSLARRQGHVLVLAGIVALGIPLAWFSDRLGHYFWSERQVIIVLVPLYILSALGVRYLLMALASVVGTASQRGWLGLPQAGWRDMRRGLEGGLALGLMAMWAALFWAPISMVYRDAWLTKEDWRAVAGYIQKNGCPGDRYWTFLNERYSYGFGYYDRALIPHSRFLFVAPDGSYDPSPASNVARQGLGSRDWIVVTVGIAASPAADGTQDSVLKSLGWSSTPFRGLLVYHQRVCGATT